MNEEVTIDKKKKQNNHHKHSHHHEINRTNENKTLIVIIFTIITMFAEISYGYTSHSMALLADGYHMGTHALALSLTFLAYLLTRKYEQSDLFIHGPEKIGTLSAYTSSLFLGFTGIWIIIEAINRIFNPLKISFNEAIIVAFIGLIVNAICILIMENKHNHKHENENKDYNFMAAYYHILADALTSVLAIAALFIGKHLHIMMFDSIIGILGGVLILRWAIRILKDTVKILIDMKTN